MCPCNVFEGATPTGDCEPVVIVVCPWQYDRWWRWSRGPIPRPRSLGGTHACHSHAIGACAVRRNPTRPSTTYGIPHLCVPGSSYFDCVPLDMCSAILKYFITNSRNIGQPWWLIRYWFWFWFGSDHTLNHGCQWSRRSARRPPTLGAAMPDRDRSKIVVLVLVWFRPYS